MMILYGIEFWSNTYYFTGVKLANFEEESDRWEAEIVAVTLTSLCFSHMHFQYQIVIFLC